MTERLRVLIGTADETFGRNMARYVGDVLGHFARAVPDIVTGIAAFNEWLPHVAVCEQMQAAFDAVEFCRRVRAVSPCPVIVLFRQPQYQGHVVLDAGADMFLRAPFTPDDIRGAIDAVRRRSEYRDIGPEVMERGDFRLIPQTRRCIVRGHEVRLTAQEFKLLVFLLTETKQVFSHHELGRTLWGSDYAGKPEFLRPLILQLRKKIEKNWRQPAYIITEHGVGYRMVPGAACPLTMSARAGT